MQSDSSQIIEMLTAQFRALVTDNWLELWGYRDGEKPLKAALTFSIDCRRQEYEITSGLAYGIRIKHKKNAVLNCQQTLLKFDGANGREKEKQTPL